MTKKDRKLVILELIEQIEISTQEELTNKLIEQGFSVSQATVSRDISELNLIKVEGNKRKTRYMQAKIGNKEVSQKIVELFRNITQSIESANNFIVVKTLVGNANSAGMAIDQMHFPQIVGSVAGDDTLLIVTKNNADAEIVLKSLRILLNAQ